MAVVDDFWILAMMPFKYLLAIFIAAAAYVSDFLYYLLPNLSFWLYLASEACWIPVILFSVSALFRRNWRAIAIFSIAWTLTVLPLVRLEAVERFRFWLNVQGFSVHAVPAERYFSRCKLIFFVEDGVEHRLGECENIQRSIDFRDVIFYDATGQLALAPAQRTRGWKDAMYYNFSPHLYLAERAVGALLFGKFYVVVIPTDAEEGG